MSDSQALAKGAGSSRSRLRSSEDRWAQLLIVAVWAWVVAPRVLQSVIAPKSRNAVGVPSAPPSAVTSLLQLALTLLLIGLCALIVVQHAKDRRPRPIAPLFVLLAPWFFIVVRDLYVGDSPGLNTILYPLIVGAVWMLRPSVDVLRTLGVLIGITAAVSIALAVAMPDRGVLRTSSGVVVTEDKELLPWGILIGFLTHGNSLGQWMALGLPWVATIQDRRLRLAFLFLTVLCVIWSASRSSMGALVAATGTAAILTIITVPARRQAAWFAALGAFLVVILLPLITTDPRAFTNRGLVWQFSFEYWASSPITGLGSGFYARVGNSTERLASTVFHGHNQFVQLLITGGIVLTALMLVQILVVIHRVAQLAARGYIAPVAYLVAFATVCTLERAFTLIGDNSASLPTVVLPFAVLAFGRRTDEETSRSLNLPSSTRSPTDPPLPRARLGQSPHRPNPVRARPDFR